MTGCGCELDETANLERRTLRVLLAINGFMFIAEAMAGWWAESTALIADSLDMFADASVYGVTLFAVARSRHLQANAASISGILQIALGIGVLLEVVRRYFYGSDPVSMLMMAVGAVALLANVTCLILIAKHRKGGVHMRASWIFSTNDVIANVGVILSGGLVMYFGNRFPDLLIGGIISFIVFLGGIRILREAKYAREEGFNA